MQHEFLLKKLSTESGIPKPWRLTWISYWWQYFVFKIFKQFNMLQALKLRSSENTNIRVVKSRHRAIRLQVSLGQYWNLQTSFQHRLYKVKTGHLAACGCPIGGAKAVKGLLVVWGIRRKAWDKDATCAWLALSPNVVEQTLRQIVSALLPDGGVDRGCKLSGSRSAVKVALGEIDWWLSKSTSSGLVDWEV